MPIDIGQSKIIENCIKYIERKAKKFPDQYKKEDIAFLKKMNEGQCSGLAALWMYRKSRDEDEQFRGHLEQISQWEEERLKAAKVVSEAFKKAQAAGEIAKKAKEKAKEKKAAAKTPAEREVAKKAEIDAAEKTKAAEKALHEAIDAESVAKAEEEYYEGSTKKTGLFDHFINDMRWAFGVDNAMGYGQRQLGELFDVVTGGPVMDLPLPKKVEILKRKLDDPMLSPEKRERVLENYKRSLKKYERQNEKNKRIVEGQRGIKREFNMAFVFKKKELIQTLNLILNSDNMDRKMIRLGSTTHAIGAMKINGKYHLYDPISETGESEPFDSVEALEEAMEKLFFKDFGRDCQNLPISIFVYRRGNQKQSNLPLSGALISKFIEANKDINRTAWDGVTPLMFAAMRSDTSALNTLIEHNADLNIKSKKGATALEFAISEENTEAIAALLAAGAKVKPEKALVTMRTAIAMKNDGLLKASLTARGVKIRLNEKDGSFFIEAVHQASALMKFASDMGHSGLMKASLDAGINANVQDGFLLRHAIEKGQLDVVKTLIEANANVNVRWNHRMTPLMLAASKGQTEIVKILLRSGANVNAQDDDGWSVLMRAAAVGNSDIMHALLNAKVDVHATNKYSQTALMIAAGKGKEEIVNALLKVDPKVVNAEDRLGSSALEQAARYGHPEVVKILLKAGLVDRNNLGLNAAGSKGHIKVVEVLLNANPTLEVSTALSRAAEEGHIEVVKMLLEKNKNPKIDKNNALMDAVENGKIDVVKLLVKNGANINYKRDGQTPLDVAIENGRDSLVKFLVENHAKNNLEKEFLIKQLKDFDKYKEEINKERRTQNAILSFFSNKHEKAELVRKVTVELKKAIEVSNKNPEKALDNVAKKIGEFAKENKKIEGVKISSTDRLGNLLKKFEEGRKEKFGNLEKATPTPMHDPNPKMPTVKPTSAKP